MSQTHIHAEKAPPKRNRLAESAAIVAALVFFGVLLAFGVYWRGNSDSARETADAKILDTRIAVVSVRESKSGTWAEYRIEAYVAYDLHGQAQDRWVPASEPQTDRRLLEARLGTRPNTCEVSWPKLHPENARCRLR